MGDYKTWHLIIQERDDDIVALRSALAARDERVRELEAGLRKADQALGIAYDWNLYEIEIDGEMVNTADLQSEFRALLAPPATKEPT